MKKIVLLLCAVLITSGIPISAAANATPISMLSSIEQLMYGEVESGSLLERIEKLELDIYGETRAGAAMLRIDRVNTFLQSTEAQDGSMRLHLNLAEWGFTGILTDGQPLIKRLENLESQWYGEPQTGPIAERTRELMMMTWGTTKLDVSKVNLPAESLVQIKLTSPVNSGTALVGDVVPYRVVDDVMVGGRIVIPAGTEGYGTVSEVTTAGRLGRDGRIVIDFGSVASLDGTFIKLRVDQRATEENRSMELAAGASMAGIMLLGPVGLVGGYFVRGRDVGIEADTAFFVETERQSQVSGFILRPAAQQ